MRLLSARISIAVLTLSGSSSISQVIGECANLGASVMRVLEGNPNGPTNKPSGTVALRLVIGPSVALDGDETDSVASTRPAFSNSAATLRNGLADFSEKGSEDAAITKVWTWFVSHRPIEVISRTSLWAQSSSLLDSAINAVKK